MFSPFSSPPFIPLELELPQQGAEKLTLVRQKIFTRYHVNLIWRM